MGLENEGPSEDFQQKLVAAQQIIPVWSINKLCFCVRKKIPYTIHKIKYTTKAFQFE